MSGQGGEQTEFKHTSPLCDPTPNIQLVRKIVSPKRAALLEEVLSKNKS